MKYAKVSNDVIVGVTLNPQECFHPTIALKYSTEVPDDAEPGDKWDGETLTKREVPTPLESYKKLSPIQFKLCFTPSERIAIAALKETDLVVADAYSILDDPRLTEVDLGLKSNRDLIDYLVTLNAITPERATQIKSGIML